jgi:pilus assembly protein CpaB
MFARVAIYLVLLVGLGGFGLTLWLGLHNAHHAAVVAATPAPPPMRKVLVAAADIRAGNLLATGDLTSREMPADKVPGGAVTDTPEARAALFGSMVRRSVAASQPVLEADTLRPGDHGFLAAVLGSGRLAVTVAVDAVSGSAGLIWPGDHVNLVLTQTLDDKDRPIGRKVAAETVLSDVRVIAIDQHLMEGATGDKTQQPQAGTVTLEVTPEQDEKVAVATRLGHLSLAVLSAAGGIGSPPAARQTVTWAKDVSPALAEAGSPATATPPPALRIYRGPTDAQEYR